MRWRYLLILALVFAPMIVLLLAGAWAIWQNPGLGWLFWLPPVCWGAAYVLVRWWRKKLVGKKIADIEPLRHWTERDQAALKIVAARQEAVAEVSLERLTEPRFYLDTATELAAQLAEHYHPKSKDLFGALTIVEILAVAELAIEESADWVNEYVPGSQLLTVNQWRALSNTPKWFRAISDMAWLSSLAINPGFALRSVSSRLAASSVSTQVQSNVLASLYVAFVRFCGIYLIEMNSGRLRGGAKHYRQFRDKLQLGGLSVPTEDGSLAATPGGAAGPSEAVQVTIALVGQVNSGKSSLVNALLGENKAATDVLPKTRKTERFAFQLPGSLDRLVLLDTPGYGEQGATAAQIEEIHVALAQSDLVLLVMDVTSPARKPDVELTETLKKWSRRQPKLKIPTAVGVMTHIDGLRPVMEWSPPYNWQQPLTAKEQTICEAVNCNREIFGEFLQGVIPVCTDVNRGQDYGVQEWLLPAMLACLEGAHASSLLRSLHQEIERGQFTKVFGQLYKAGLQILKASVAK